MHLTIVACLEGAKVLDGLDAELVGGVVVEGHGGVGVELEDRARPHVVDALLDAVRDGARLVVPRGDDEDLARVGHGAHAHAEGAARDLAQVAVKEARVGDHRVVREVAHARTRRQRAPGLVERDVAVRADAAKEQVDAARLLDQALVPRALGHRVRRVPVQDVHVLRPRVHVVKQVAVHEAPVALGVAPRQAHILVHVERHHVAERQRPLLHKLHQALVRPNRRRAGRQAQHKWPLSSRLKLVDPLPDILGHKLAHSLVVFANNHTHSLVEFEKKRKLGV